MNNSDLLTFLLTRVDLFSDFPAEKLESLINNARKTTFEPNTAFIKFGTENQNLYILLDGEADVIVFDKLGERHRVAHLTAGDMCGEISLMTGDRTIAEVITTTTMTALTIPDHHFISAVSAFPRTLRKLNRQVSAKTLNFTRYLPHPKAEPPISSDDPYGLKLYTSKPMKILVINCGSSSLKYSLFDTANDSVQANGLVDNIGMSGGRHKFTIFTEKYERTSSATNFDEAFNDMLSVLTDEHHRCFNSPDEIRCIGHRIVHGGKYSGSAIITAEVIAEIEDASKFAPLHNPAHLRGIHAALANFPNASHVAVFDTAFHQTLPDYAYLYALPYELYEQKKIRRYGFHGTSHHFVALKAAQFLKCSISSTKLISCHLGNGASMCAIDQGRSVDTTMGLTPTAGLVMGTRSGDIDPTILCHLQRSEGYSVEDCERLLNRKSGLQGISGVSSDMRAIVEAAGKGNERAALAIKCFGYQVRKNIGAYTAALGGLHAIIFTGGIGQYSPVARRECCKGLEYLGIHLDDVKNMSVDLANGPVDISMPNSLIRILVIATDEERMIARETLYSIRNTSAPADEKPEQDKTIPIEVSAHHAHLSAEHVEVLFGKGHTLTPHGDLSQPGQFACKEQVTLCGPKGVIERVRVLGPARKESQVEISMTERFKLGVQPPIRESGDIAGTPGIILKGPEGDAHLEKGIICAKRHIHMTPEDSKRLGVRDKQLVRVRVDGERGLTFSDVVVRVNPSFKLAMHIDTDEANAANISGNVTGVIV